VIASSITIPLFQSAPVREGIWALLSDNNARRSAIAPIVASVPYLPQTTFPLARKRQGLIKRRPSAEPLCRSRVRRWHP
jgi:hypothetical protein